ncbi:adenomatous polyposis coli protein [Caerostris extrusa]|uniref:Adenomatous polyposis coli protein n=1 Tax=Caerostris extrusa TaxID=172846 RepID=A0AAV4PM89_CAEEX|nr:adenomatous polyposis coli protein [Caerostris extrusa]
MHPCLSTLACKRLDPSFPHPQQPPSEYSISESRPRASVPNHLEWSSNIYQSRLLHQNDYRRDLREYRERERTSYGRIYSNARPRYDHYSHVDRRPFLNQNYTRLPYNMVRIKNSNDDDQKSNSMNGFTEDDEGNHECHDLCHSSSPGLDPSSELMSFIKMELYQWVHQVVRNQKECLLWKRYTKESGQCIEEISAHIRDCDSVSYRLPSSFYHNSFTGVKVTNYCQNRGSSENVKWAVREARRRASQALHNIVHAHPDDRRGRREARVLRLLEQIRDYSDFLRDLDSSNMDFSHNENLDLHPGPAIAALMKLSFDEEHRHAMCQLGGLQAIAELIQADHEVHGNTSDQFCVTVRRYAGMALTNLTFGDGTNKALLCSMKPFMQALVAQLHSPNEDLRQVTASVLRNLSWRADASSKQILREVGVVTTLMKASMEAQKESTLKSILSALWNLSAHCSMNKSDICEVEGALEFLVSTLTYKSSSSTLSIIENGGGILRNISSHIAVREDYRVTLRKTQVSSDIAFSFKITQFNYCEQCLWNSMEFIC